MQTSSADYKTAIAATEREIRGYLKFNNTFTMTGADGLISFKTTQNIMEAERYCVGSVTSCFCEATFYNSGLAGSGVSLANSYFDAYCGVVTDPSNNTVEYVCCGRYWVSEITRGKETTKIVGYDIAGRLSVDYVPTVTPDPDDGYLVMDILNDIIDQTNINGGTHFTTYGDSVYVPEIYEGTCRQQWGWLCALVDEEASSYTGTRDPADLGYLKKYVAGNGEVNPYAVSETTTYLDGASFGDEYTITSFTTGTTDTPIVIGNGTGVYGLNPYMDNATATTIEGTVDNYQYYPATLHWRGDPCLDVLDEIVVTQGADTYKMLAMKIETTFNGGLEQTINCFGDSEEYYALSTSPTQAQITQVSNLVNEIQQAIETADGGVITKILDVDGTWKELVIANNQDLSQATSVWRFNINGLAHSDRYSGGTYTLAMDTQGRIVANVIQTGILQDALGKNSWNLDTGALTITNGSINITTTSETVDQIVLHYNTWMSSMRAGSIYVSNSSDGWSSSLNGGALYTTHFSVDPNIHPLEISFGAVRFRDGNTNKLQQLIYANQVEQYDYNGDLRQKIGIITPYDDGGVSQYDSSGTLLQQVRGDGSILQNASSGTLRQKLNNEGKLWQYDANSKLRTYLEYGDIYLKNASEVTRTHLNSQGELEQFDTSSVRRTYLGWGDLYLFDANAKTRSHIDSAGKVTLHDANGAQQTKLCVLTSSAWNKGRDNATLINSKQPSTTGDYHPVVSTKAYASDWSIGALGNDLYILNTLDTNYSSNTNRCCRYKLANVDSSSAFLSYDILSTANTTDRVIEQGTASSWNYRKWASGVYECWARIAYNVAISATWGSLYYYEIPQQNYPITFSSNPYEVAQIAYGQGYTAFMGCGANNPSTTKTGSYYLMRPTSTTAHTYYINYYVRGTL